MTLCDSLLVCFFVVLSVGGQENGDLGTKMVPVARTVIFEWLKDDAICKDLELTDEQVAQLQHVSKELGLPERIPLESEWGVAYERVERVLLPHQVILVNQMAVRRHVIPKEGRWSFGVLELQRQLKLSSTQKKVIQELSDSWRQENFNANIESMSSRVELLEEAEKEVLSELTKEQKKKFHEVFGPPVVVMAGAK